MKEFKLKLVLSILTGVVFSFIFILLAFVLPTSNYKVFSEKKSHNILKEISKSINK